MEILNIELIGYTKLVFTVNILVLLVLSLFVVCSVLIKNRKHNALKSISICEATIGIGNSKVTIKYDNKIQEIAYKIWVELNTRKIAMMFVEGQDVITEVYNSWYSAFVTIRELLKEIPADRIKDAEGLIDLTTKVLNEGLRPHLTKWQAKYRCWFEQEKESSPQMEPQEIQGRYPYYQELVTELKHANKIMIQFSKELYKIAYDKQE